MEEVQLTLPPIADGEDKSSALGNRVRKIYRHLRKWAKRTGTDCFRLYDKEIGEYPLAIDFYAGRFCVHYFSTAREIEQPPQDLIDETVKVLVSIFNVTPEAIYWRIRAKRKTTRQYEKIGESKEFFPVYEYGVKFLINLEDYLDTGLFLDHRETRHRVALCAKGKRLLNLFAYTCSFSVQAAAAGALFTKSVDMSNTYTQWGRENFELNGFSSKNHEIICADCLKFLDEEIYSKAKYDLIVIDPPTISRSKKMDQLFDVQIDYVFLITKALKLLAKEGCIFFSTNSRRFVFDKDLFPDCTITEISHKTLPIDFHDPKIHRCWTIS
ncbi:MAG: class I SAM-dependent methyltransferase [Chlamydiota bacterium]